MESMPHAYALALSWSHGRTGRLVLEHRPSIDVAPPPALEGPKDRWSPEHLLLASVAGCLMTTFLTFASREELVPRGYRTEVRGRVGRTHAGVSFTEIALTVVLDVGTGETRRAELLLARAKDACVVTNSLASPVTLDARVREV